MFVLNSVFVLIHQDKCVRLSEKLIKKQIDMIPNLSLIHALISKHDVLDIVYLININQKSMKYFRQICMHIRDTIYKI